MKTKMHLCIKPTANLPEMDNPVRPITRGLNNNTGNNNNDDDDGDDDDDDDDEKNFI